MKKADKQTVFVEDVAQKAQLTKCPILCDWIYKKFEEINQVPIEMPRKGVKKGAKIGIPRYKLALALWQIIYPKMRLREFAKAFDLPYGSVCNWAADRVSKEKKEKWLNEFCDLYLEKLYKLIESKKDNYESIKSHIAEIQFYKNVHLANLIGNLFFFKFLGLVKTGFFTANLQSTYCMLSLAILGNKEVGDPDAHRKFYEESLKEWSELVKTSIKHIRGTIGTNNKLAKQHLRALEANLLEGIMPVWRKLLMESYDYKHGLKKHPK